MTEYFVYKEHTLVYSMPHHPWPDWYGILHASILRGSTLRTDDGITHIQDKKNLRPATAADFEAFNIRPEGHLI